MNFNIRITPFEFEELYRSRIDEAFSRFDKVLGVYHIGTSKENPHFHFCIRNSKDFTGATKPTNSLWNYLKKHFDKASFIPKGNGNKHQCCKQADDRLESLSYLFHEEGSEEFEVVINKGFTEQEILELKGMNYQRQAVIAESKPDVMVKAVVEIIRTDVISLIPKKAEAFFKEQTLDMKSFQLYFNTTHSNVLFYKLRKKVYLAISQFYYEKGDWEPNKFQFERYISKVIVLLLKGSEVSRQAYWETQFETRFGRDPEAYY